MFREALDYPTRPPRGGRAVLVGGTLLVLVGALAGVATLEAVLAPVAVLAVVPWLLVRGYYVRVLRTTLGHEYPTPPGFGDVGRLLRDGLAAALIAVGYLLPGVAVLAPFVYARTQGADLVGLLLGESVSPAVADGATGAAGIVALLAVFSLIGATYVLPVAVANYASTERIRAAFELRTVVSGAATEDYVVAWGVSLLLQLLVLPVAYLLKPILAGFYLHFLVAVGVRYCYGQGVGAALGFEPPEPAFEGAAAITIGSGSPEPAVRHIEESDAPELRTSGNGDGAEADAGADPTADTDAADDPFEYPARERREGERT